METREHVQYTVCTGAYGWGSQFAMGNLLKACVGMGRWDAGTGMSSVVISISGSEL